MNTSFTKGILGEAPFLLTVMLAALLACLKFYIYNINNLHCLLDCKKQATSYVTYKKGIPPFSRLSAVRLLMYIVTLELYQM